MQIIQNGKKYADNNVDIKQKIVTFDSGDELEPTAPAEVPLVSSGSLVKNLMRSLSLAVKNTRYLLKMLGTADISQIGDGTVTGAISELNTGSSDTNISDYDMMFVNYIKSNWGSLDVSLNKITLGSFNIGPYCVFFYQKHTNEKYGAVLMFGYSLLRPIYMSRNGGDWYNIRYL